MARPPLKTRTVWTPLATHGMSSLGLAMYGSLPAASWRLIRETMYSNNLFLFLGIDSDRTRLISAPLFQCVGGAGEAADLGRGCAPYSAAVTLSQPRLNGTSRADHCERAL
jgi:hypothetical protein